jgi:hypothetical protein
MDWAVSSQEGHQQAKCGVANFPKESPNLFSIQNQKINVPKSSKLPNEEKQKKERADNQRTELNTSKYFQGQDEKLSNEKIKARIEQRIIRSMTNKMLMKKHSSQAIATINNLMIPEKEKLKFKIIANKIYHSVNLTQEEKVFWNLFPNSENHTI